jgi:hypothetical protein
MKQFIEEKNLAKIWRLKTHNLKNKALFHKERLYLLFLRNMASGAPDTVLGGRERRTEPGEER